MTEFLIFMYAMLAMFVLITIQQNNRLERPTPQAIAGALRRLIHDDDLRRRMGEAGAAHARQSFDPIRNARAVEALYAGLLSGAAARDGSSSADRPEHG